MKLADIVERLLAIDIDDTTDLYHNALILSEAAEVIKHLREENGRRMGSYDLHPIDAREIISKHVLTLSEDECNLIKWSREGKSIMLNVVLHTGIEVRRCEEDGLIEVKRAKKYKWPDGTKQYLRPPTGGT